MVLCHATKSNKKLLFFGLLLSWQKVLKLNITNDITIDQIKSSFNKKPQVEIVTIKELKNKLNFEKINSKPFVPKIYKEERRKLKGFFMKEFVTSGELFEKEKSLTKITNSKYFEKLKRFEMVDRKNLEKRIEQRVKRLD